jgi:hypothetical protein
MKLATLAFPALRRRWQGAHAFLAIVRMGTTLLVLGLLSLDPPLVRGQVCEGDADLAMCTAEGTPCNGGLGSCTSSTDSTCTGGCFCATPCVTDADCDDSDACTDDRCDLPDGLCVSAPLACDDGDPCTDERCVLEDGLPACVHTTNAAPCDDGNPRTTSDTCAGGSCAGMPASHFLCYRVAPLGSLASAAIELVTRFGAYAGTPRAASVLCAPANKNDEDPGAPSDPIHMTAYDVRTDLETGALESLTVVNQFGTLPLKVNPVRPKRLLVPSAKGLNGPPEPLAEAIGHFACFRIRYAAARPRFAKILGVMVETQLDAGPIDLVKPSQLCVPTNVNRQTPGVHDHPTHLLCYRARTRRPVGALTVFIDNRFGSQRYRLDRVRELCVPSSVGPTP